MKEITAIIKSLFLYVIKLQFLILISCCLVKQNSKQEKNEKKFSD